MVAFRPFNLLDDLSALGQFDIVLCRNVLIYFDQPTKTRILDAHRTAPGARRRLAAGRRRIACSASAMPLPTLPDSRRLWPCQANQTPATAWPVLRRFPPLLRRMT